MVFSQSLVVPNNSSGNYLVPRPSLSVPYLRGMPFQLRFGLVAKLLARGLLGASGRLGFPGQHGCLQSNRGHLSWRGQRPVGAAAAPVSRAWPPLPSEGGAGAWCRLEAPAAHRSHTGCRGREGGFSAAAGCGEHKQRGEDSLGLTLCVLLGILDISDPRGRRPEMSRVLPLGATSPSRSVELPETLRDLLGTWPPHTPPGQTGWFSLAKPCSHGTS